MSNFHNTTVVVAFDYGLSKIGAAVGQSITGTATPLPAVKAKKGHANWEGIKNIVKEWHAEAFVVGMPYNMDGTEQAISQRCKQFARELEQHFALPVYFIDERLTTKSAEDQLLQQRGKLSKIKRGDVDSYAAKLILETFFRSDSHEGA